jgi:RNA polymerase sigma-70 factor (ECF subfamily)
MDRVRKDRDNRFGELVLPHLEAVYRAAVALSGQGPQAEDLTQTTFLKALETLDSFVEGTNCKAWLLRILRNTWIDVLRRRKTAGTTVPVEEALVAAPEEPAATQWTDARDLLENFADEEIIQSLSELPDDQRLTLYLVDVEQLDHREVADVMGVPIGTIKSRASRARAALKQRLRARAMDLGFIGRVDRGSSER